MRRERTSQPTDLAPHLDEPAEHLVLALDVAGSHRRRVDVLEHELDVLERVEVALEHPLEQVGKQLEPVEPPRVARAAGALAEPLERPREALRGP